MAKYIVVHSVKVATEFVPQTFGRLTTIGPKFRLPAGNLGKYSTYQVCQCACGNTIVADRNNLKTRHTNSCGCLHKERITQANTTHGMQQSSAYNNYMNMQVRCGNPNHHKYHRYGGRGIRVCARWQEPNGQGLLNFLSDMGPKPSKKHSIDRIDNDGHYCPENCRWATSTEQNRNQRRNVNITFNGKTQCLADWAEELGYTRGLIRDRLHSGWSVEKALTTPAKTYNAKKNT